MTNRIAIVLAVMILAAVAFDGLARDWQAVLFLARKGLLLIDYMKFWR